MIHLVLLLSLLLHGALSPSTTRAEICAAPGECSVQQLCEQDADCMTGLTCLSTNGGSQAECVFAFALCEDDDLCQRYQGADYECVTWSSQDDRTCFMTEIACVDDSKCPNDWKCTELGASPEGIAIPAHWQKAGPIQRCIPAAIADQAQFDDYLQGDQDALNAVLASQQADSSDADAGSTAKGGGKGGGCSLEHTRSKHGAWGALVLLALAACLRSSRRREHRATAE